MTTPPAPDAQPPHTNLVSVRATGPARPARKRRKQASRAKKPDRRRKTWSSGITSQERRDLVGADIFAWRLRRPLNTTLDFHPVHLDAFPEGELDAFFAGLRIRISTWCGRRKIGCYWVWTRENYEGWRREHLHMVMHLPPRLRAELETHIRSLYPGNPKLVQVGERKRLWDRDSGRWVDGLAYRMKQLRGNAVGPPGRYRLNRETKSRHDGSPVAPVYGKRCGVSDSLTEKVERRWNDAQQQSASSQLAAA